jgi:transposase
MKKTRRRYDRDFKISVLIELEAGKPLAQIAREYGIYPSLPCQCRIGLKSEKAFRGNGNIIIGLNVPNSCPRMLPILDILAYTCIYLAASSSHPLGSYR